MPRNLITKKASRIRYLLLDVDGVLTNGTVYLNKDGEDGVGFSIYDGMGIVLCRQANLPVGFVSGRESLAVARRAADLGIKDCYLGILDKITVYFKLLTQYGLKDDEVAYIGDDIIDLPILRRVGLSVSVPNAMEVVKKEVDYITERKGGEGAVRELIDILLMASGKMPSVQNEGTIDE
ncbi:MAG: HAD-IIIA family hydrolase [Nitrospirota bacterium]|mgnify:CR=1 FL=1